MTTKDAAFEKQSIMKQRQIQKLQASMEECKKKIKIPESVFKYTPSQRASF